MRNNQVHYAENKVNNLNSCKKIWSWPTPSAHTWVYGCQIVGKVPDPLINPDTAIDTARLQHLEDRHATLFY